MNKDPNQILTTLMKGEDIGEQNAFELMQLLATGTIDPAVAGAILTSLRIKGESAEEVRGFANAMRELATTIDLEEDDTTIDIVGTGGDGSNSFNLSTGTALLSAAAGLQVAKHGNRSVSSKSGSADVLEALGITLAAERGWHPISCQYVQAHWVKTHLPKYLEGLRNAGLPEDPSGWKVAKCIFVADDQKTADSYAKSEEGPYGYYFSNLMKKLGSGGRLGLFGIKPDQPVDEITLRQSLDTQVIAGTVDSVVDQILELREEVGAFGTLVYTGLDWADKSLSRRSMVLMAEEVLPRVNRIIN